MRAAAAAEMTTQLQCVPTLQLPELQKPRRSSCVFALLLQLPKKLLQQRFVLLLARGARKSRRCNGRSMPLLSL
jgi:hypothetical protein